MNLFFKISNKLLFSKPQHVKKQKNKYKFIKSKQSVSLQNSKQVPQKMAVIQSEGV